MTITNKVTLKSLNAGLTPATDVPDAPTIGTATAGLLSASVTFTAAATGGTPTSYTVTSSPEGLTGTGASSPITVSGLTGGTSYTFTVTATNSAGTSPASSASNSATPATPLGYESIATTSVGSGGTSSISFTSIPSTFTHLQVRAILRNTAATSGASSVGFRLNSDSGANYTWHYLQGDGASATAGAATGYTYAYMALNINGGNTANVWATTVLDILDYANTNKNKTLRSLGGYDNNGAGQIQLQSSAWLSTSAVTRIDIFPSANNFAQYSHFALYGVK